MAQLWGMFREGITMKFAEMDTIFCNRCQSPLRANDNFCSHCGQRVQGRAYNFDPPMSDASPFAQASASDAAKRASENAAGSNLNVPGHTALNDSAANASNAPDQPTTKSRRWDNRSTVLIMLFLVLGPFGLPMLWISRAFSPLWKILLTTVMLALTGLIVYSIYRLFVLSLAPLNELMTLQSYTLFF
jgi:hypothetical protein